MAAAVRRLFPGARLDIGPATDDGFYYDFDLPHRLQPEDFPRIEAELARIAAERKKAEENLQRIEAKLANESFTSRAPENVVNAEREKAEKARALIAKLDESAAAMKL